MKITTILLATALLLVVIWSFNQRQFDKPIMDKLSGQKPLPAEIVVRGRKMSRAEYQNRKKELKDKKVHLQDEINEIWAMIKAEAEINGTYNFNSSDFLIDQL